MYTHIMSYTTCIVHSVSCITHRAVTQSVLRDKDLYTTTNKCLQCLIKTMYTVF